MTEAEWLASDDPTELLTQLDAKSVTTRKLRLFCCGCVRRVWDRLPRWGACRHAVETTELFVESQATLDKLIVSSEEAEQEARRQSGWTKRPAAQAAIRCASEVMTVTIATSVSWRVSDASRSGKEAERSHHATFIRDIFGNPFRPITFAPEWRTDTALALARQMYESLDISAMPILADALQDAGCDNPDVLNHCRGDGTHVRGCWVVDLMLSKE